MRVKTITEIWGCVGVIKTILKTSGWRNLSQNVFFFYKFEDFLVSYENKAEKNSAWVGPRLTFLYLMRLIFFDNFYYLIYEYRTICLDVQLSDVTNVARYELSCEVLFLNNEKVNFKLNKSSE